MVLGAFGDSFIYGTDLQDCQHLFKPGDDVSAMHSHLSWPALIAQNLNLSYLCYALPGIGNHRILNSVLTAIQQHKNKCFYIINWSWIDRFDYYKCSLKKINEYQTLRPIDNDSITEFYYKNLHSELYDKTQSLGYVYQAITALEDNDCKYIMTNMDRLLVDKLYHCPPHCEFKIDAVEPNLKSFDGQSFYDWSKQNNYPISTNMHPLELAHKKAAEYWLPEVRTLLNTCAKED